MKYNHLAYNRGSESETLIESSVIFAEVVLLDYSKSVAIESNIAFSEKIYFFAELDRSLVRAVEISEGLRHEIVPSATLDRSMDFADRIKFEVEFGKDMSASERFMEEIRAKIESGKLISTIGIFDLDILTESELCKLINTSVDYTDNLNLLSSARTLNEEVTTLTVELQPGSVLEIDSEFYTVDLDGVNAFDKYSGEWLYLSRDLTDVVITANGSGLEAEILYRERYL